MHARDNDISTNEPDKVDPPPSPAHVTDRRYSNELKIKQLMADPEVWKKYSCDVLARVVEGDIRR